MRNGIVTLLFCASLKKCIFIHFLGSNCFNFEIILQTVILFESNLQLGLSIVNVYMYIILYSMVHGCRNKN